eukprot:10183075-Lingulodinium_polyedra.AAC.1
MSLLPQRVGAAPWQPSAIWGSQPDPGPQPFRGSWSRGVVTPKRAVALQSPWVRRGVAPVRCGVSGWKTSPGP